MKSRLLLPLLGLLLGGCQSAALMPAAQAESPTADPGCRALAERYGTFYVALATWDYAQTPRKASREELQAGMAQARAQAQALGCPPFWEQ